MYRGDLLDYNDYLVFGAALSGLAAARLLVARGKTVVLYDEGPGERIAEAQAEAQRLGVEFLTDPADLQARHFEVMILSPGIPESHPVAYRAEERGMIVRSEIELGFQACSVPVLAITGTNGKTTVTHLVQQIFEHAGFSALVAGNVGIPLSDAVMDSAIDAHHAVIVCEVSSFQLETIEVFSPKVSCVLNITPDHLDRYPSMDMYISAKRRITENQDERQHLVLNADDPICCSLSAGARACLWQFSLQGPVHRGAWIEANGHVFLRVDEKTKYVMDRNQIMLMGMHNVANVLAALTIGAAMGLDAPKMREGVESFRAVRHRLEWVAEVDGVPFYNDSKATNLDSMRKALESFNEPLVLIAGGRDKRGDWGSMHELVAGRVKSLVMIGEARSLGIDAWGDVVSESRTAKSMPEAVRIAAKLADGQGVVLLSPGCSSYDMFEDFEQRGEVFCAAVRDLEKKK